MGCTPVRSLSAERHEKKNSPSGTKDLKSLGSRLAITEHMRAYLHTSSMPRSCRVVTIFFKGKENFTDVFFTDIFFS